MILAAIALLVATAHHPASHPHVLGHRGHGEAPAQQGSSLKTYKIGITGITTEYDGMAHTYSITGNVKVVLDNMTVTCNQAIITTSADEERVDKILFLGRVVAVRDRNTFRGDKVTYFVASKRLLAQGDTATHIFMSGRSNLPQSPDSQPQGSP